MPQKRGRHATPPREAEALPADVQQTPRPAQVPDVDTEPRRGLEGAGRPNATPGKERFRLEKQVLKEADMRDLVEKDTHLAEVYEVISDTSKMRPDELRKMDIEVGYVVRCKICENHSLYVGKPVSLRDHRKTALHQESENKQKDRILLQYILEPNPQLPEEYKQHFIELAALAGLNTCQAHKCFIHSLAFWLPRTPHGAKLDYSRSLSQFRRDWNDELGEIVTSYNEETKKLAAASRHSLTLLFDAGTCHNMHIMFGVLYCGTERRFLQPQVANHTDDKGPGVAFNQQLCANAIRSMLATVGLTMKDIRAVMADRVSYHSGALQILLGEAPVFERDDEPAANQPAANHPAANQPAANPEGAEADPDPDGNIPQVVVFVADPGALLEGVAQRERDLKNIFAGCLAHAVNNVLTKLIDCRDPRSPWYSAFDKAIEALQLFYRGMYQAPTRRSQFESYLTNSPNSAPTESNAIRLAIKELKADGNFALDHCKRLFQSLLREVNQPAAAITVLEGALKQAEAQEKKQDVRPRQLNATRYNMSLYESFDQMDRLAPDILSFCQSLNLKPEKSLKRLAVLLSAHMTVIRQQLRKYKDAVKPAIEFMEFVGDRSNNKPVAHLVGRKGILLLDHLLHSDDPLAKHLGRELTRYLETKPALRWSWWKAVRLLSPFRLAAEWNNPLKQDGLFKEFSLLGFGVTREEFQRFAEFCQTVTLDTVEFWEFCVKGDHFKPWNAEALATLHMPPSVLEVDSIISVANYIADPRIDRLSPSRFSIRVMTHLIAQQDSKFSEENDD